MTRNELAQHLAQHLGNAWGWEEMHQWGSKVFHSNGMGIFLNDWKSQGNRVEVSGIWPKWGSHTWSPRESLKVSVSLARAPEAILADLKRRFLEPYWKLFTQQNKAMLLHLKDMDQTTQVIRTLQKIAPGALYEEDTKLRGMLSAEVSVEAKGYISTSYRGRHIDLELHYLPCEIAVELVRFLEARLRIHAIKQARDNSPSEEE